MGREIYSIIYDMAEVLNASQMQKLQEVLVNRLSENNTTDYLQTGNEESIYHKYACNDNVLTCGKRSAMI